ncbi:MAG: Fur family transcriptional regulator [Pseudomonadota bacterium]
MTERRTPFAPPLHFSAQSHDIVGMSHHDHSTQGLTPCAPTSIDGFLREAEAIAARKGYKLTPVRKRVLELLWKAQSPAKAYDLLDQLDGVGAAKPPTVYRALEFLQAIGLAHKIESLNAYVACGHTGHAHSAVFVICTECGCAEELHSNATLAAMHADCDAVGFDLRDTVVEARGVCRKCRTRAA